MTRVTEHYCLALLQGGLLTWTSRPGNIHDLCTYPPSSEEVSSLLKLHKLYAENQECTKFLDRVTIIIREQQGNVEHTKVDVHHCMLKMVDLGDQGTFPLHLRWARRS